jgi:excisionase family DNA binding protein
VARQFTLVGGDVARIISRDELQAVFNGDAANVSPVIMSPRQLADLVGLSVKTIYAWIAAGRLDGCFRKRGKHNLIWRDKALEQILNGPDWK